MTEEGRLRERICEVGASLFVRGLAAGSSGNISAHLDGGWLMTPTGRSLGTLDPEGLSKIDYQGGHVGGEPPTKEQLLHQVMYEGQPRAGAVVHLHSTHSVAVSCLADVDPTDVLPPITAYYVMRVGRLPLVPYYPPGDAALAEVVRPLARRHHAVLLANHGPIIAGASIEAAAAAIEELEEAAKLHLLLQSHRVRSLTPEQVEALHRRFP